MARSRSKALFRSKSFAGTGSAKVLTETMMRTIKLHVIQNVGQTKMENNPRFWQDVINKYCKGYGYTPSSLLEEFKTKIFKVDVEETPRGANIQDDVHLDLPARDESVQRKLEKFLAENETQLKEAKKIWKKVPNRDVRLFCFHRLILQWLIESEGTGKGRKGTLSQAALIKFRPAEIELFWQKNGWKFCKDGFVQKETEPIEVLNNPIDAFQTFCHVTFHSGTEKYPIPATYTPLQIFKGFYFTLCFGDQSYLTKVQGAELEALIRIHGGKVQVGAAVKGKSLTVVMNKNMKMKLAADHVCDPTTVYEAVATGKFAMDFHLLEKKCFRSEYTWLPCRARGQGQEEPPQSRNGGRLKIRSVTLETDEELEEYLSVTETKRVRLDMH